MYKVFGQNIIK